MYDALKEELLETMFNLDEFGEPVTYIQKSGGERSIVALVTRKTITPSDQNRMRSLRQLCDLHIANGPQGVTFVDKGDDKVRFPEYPGGTAVEWVVEEIIEVDEFMWHVQVGR